MLSPNKIPDAVDIIIYKGIAAKKIQIYPKYNLPSDHAPVNLTHGKKARDNRQTKTKLNIIDFKRYLKE